jgi:hypothetical protein
MFSSCFGLSIDTLRISHISGLRLSWAWITHDNTELACNPVPLSHCGRALHCSNIITLPTSWWNSVKRKLDWDEIYLLFIYLRKEILETSIYYKWFEIKNCLISWWDLDYSGGVPWWDLELSSQAARESSRVELIALVRSRFKLDFKRALIM